MDRISQAYETYVSVIRNSLAQSVNQVQMAEVFRIVYQPTHWDFTLNGQKLQVFDKFVYFGSILS